MFQKRSFLEIDLVFQEIIKYLDIKDFTMVSIVNKTLNKKYNDDRFWKSKLYDIINLNDTVVSYKKQYIMNYCSKLREICSICHKLILTDFVILTHNCNYGFKNCIICMNSNKCKCSMKLPSYHSCCINKYDDRLIYCPLCNNLSRCFICTAI